MTDKTKWYAVCPVSALPEGASKTCTLGNFEVMVLNLAGEFHAIEACCTVDGTRMRLEPGKGGTLVCPHNQVHFDVRDGVPLQGPAYEPLAKFRTRVRDGMLEVCGDLWV